MHCRDLHQIVFKRHPPLIYVGRGVFLDVVDDEHIRMRAAYQPGRAEGALHGAAGDPHFRTLPRALPIGQVTPRHAHPGQLALMQTKIVCNKGDTFAPLGETVVPAGGPVPGRLGVCRDECRLGFVDHRVATARRHAGAFALDQNDRAILRQIVLLHLPQRFVNCPIATQRVNAEMRPIGVLMSAGNTTGQEMKLKRSPCPTRCA